jgi:two-component system, sensor histidine kinase and response regulator
MSTVDQHQGEETTAQLRHRLRTPLNHIIGYAEMLQEDAGDRWKQAEPDLREIVTLAGEMLQILNSVLSDNPDTAAGDNGMSRAALVPPLHRTARLCGVLMNHAPDENIHDLLRISNAVSELLSFATATDTPIPVAKTTPASVPAAKPGNRILVADDDELHRDIINRQLEKLGYAVVLAENGQQALEVLRTGKIDLVLVDMFMPEMSGLEVLETIKTDLAMQNIPVVMVSALDDLSAVSQCIERGAQDYLFKPFDPILLQSRIEAALERTKLAARERERSAILEQMSRELRRSNEELKSFAYAASHDLQSPLRTISTHLQLLERRLGNKLSPDDSKLVEFAVDAAKRMSQLIHDILVYSQASTQETELRPVSCQEVMDSTLSDLDAHITELNATVTYDALPVVMADSGQLRQLFLNLIGNALKYRKENEAPEVRVSASYEGEAWHFQVADNGEGIEEAYLREVFKMFRRLHGQDRPGTGLGLAICDRIVHRLHGTLWVESEVGVGSTFHFTVPGPREVTTAS